MTFGNQSNRTRFGKRHHETAVVSYSKLQVELGYNVRVAVLGSTAAQFSFLTLFVASR